MRCTECGARNPEGAEWCGQCLTSFAPQAPAVPAPAEPEPAVVPTAGLPPRPAAAATDPGTVPPPPPPGGLREPASVPPPPAPPSAGGPPDVTPLPAGAEPVVVGDGRFRRTDEGLDWACRLCGEWSPLERTTCGVCGTEFGAERGAGTQAPVPDVATPVLVAASVAAPGAGHVLLGRRGEGIARLLPALVWSIGGLVLLRGALAAGRAPLPAVPLLLGWLILAVTCTNDALVLSGVRGSILLSSRALLWLVVIVLGLTTVAAFVGVTAAVGS